MTSTRIYDVQMDHYAYSSTGELGSQCLGPCVAIVVVFKDNTVMIEHRSDPFLYHKRDHHTKLNELDAMDLFGNIVTNIRKFKQNDCVVRLVSFHIININKKFFFDIHFSNFSEKKRIKEKKKHFWLILINS
jgi:S-adenosylmethionine hydrolase